MQRTIFISMVFLTCGFATLGCAQTPEATADAKPADAVVATFDGGSVTAAELEEAAGPSMVKLRQQLFDAQYKALEQKLYDEIVKSAAEAAGVSREEFIKKNVTDLVEEPAEKDIEAVMRQYRPRLPKDDDEARKQVVNFLSQQQMVTRQAAFRERLFGEAGVKIMLEPPRVEMAVATHNPIRGPADAAVTIVEYTDYQCPYCDRVQPSLDYIMERYDGSVRHVFKNLPLGMHPQARGAAEAALCAADQGKFWEMHDWMFTNKQNLGRDLLVAQAAELGLEQESFVACIDSKKYKAAVQSDITEATGFGITGTPGFLVNGRVLTGAQPLEAFTAIINDELRRAGIPIPPEPEPEPEAAPATEVETS